MSPIGITGEMDAHFGLVGIGRESAIQGLMRDGVDRTAAEAERERLERRDFARREEPPFSRKLSASWIWR
jgi:hypothetical protein